jgi:hypothetical protein
VSTAHEPGSGDSPSETVPEPGTTTDEYTPEQIAAADQILAEAKDLLNKIKKDIRNGKAELSHSVPIDVTTIAADLVHLAVGHKMLAEICQALAWAAYEAVERDG